MIEIVLCAILICNILLLCNDRRRILISHITAKENNNLLMDEINTRLTELANYSIKEIKIVDATGYSDHRKECFILYYDKLSILTMQKL